uniref:Uncharacterized protein n=1 Tax=Ditylenchus dipsaci TaxID=166011 RepID=A0A915CY73_9BILA
MAISVVSVALVIKHLLWSKFKKQNLPQIHPNFTILLSNGLLLYFFHALFMLLVGASMQIKHYAHPECPFAMITWECLIFRVPVFSVIAGFTLLHFLFFLERCLATIYLKHYASHSAKFGIIACFIIRDRRVFDYNLLKSYQIAENEAATNTLAARYLFATAKLAVYVSAIETIHLLICLNILSTLASASYLMGSIRLNTSVKITSAREQADVYFNQFACQLSAENLTRKTYLINK